MNKAVRLMLIGIILLFGILIGVFLSKIRFFNSGLTGNAINTEQNYSYTTAICNSEKKCIDVIVYCINGKMIKLEPTSELKQFDENWIDPRENKTLDYCS